MLNITDKNFRFNAIISLILLLFISLISCSKDDEQDINIENEQFYELIKEWYYWTDQMPALNPSDYPDIQAVLEAVRYLPTDRWSFIEDWDVLMAFFENTEFIGYGFGSRWDSEGRLRITFVYNTVPFYELGVRRGWVIEAINGTTLAPGTNVNSLLGANEAGVTNSFRMRNHDDEIVEFEMAKEVLQVNTVLHHEVIEESGLRIGYMVLQTFTGSTIGEVRNVISTFKAEGVDEMILDLRYNGGGLTNAATILSGLIGGNDLTGQPFARYSYNRFKEDRNSVVNFGQEESSLGLERLVVIASGGTASASEMVINGLRPYMNVTIVGSATYGKPMGANILRFYNWGVAPITFNVTNADDEGNFFGGIPVDIPASDGLAYDFGDLRESALQQAVAYITMGITKTQPVEMILFEQPHESFRGIQRLTGSH